jgi:hypothetical protein
VSKRQSEVVAGLVRQLLLQDDSARLALQGDRQQEGGGWGEGDSGEAGGGGEQRRQEGTQQGTAATGGTAGFAHRSRL